MKKACILFFAGFLLIGQPSFSQEKVNKNHCRTSDVMKEHFENNSRAHHEATEFNKKTKKLINKKTFKADNEYIIPVVFHVFGTVFNGGSTVNDAIIIDALQKTNEDFQGLTADWNSVDPLFESVKAPLNITFALAELDTNGAPTTGIIYYHETAGFGNGSGYTDSIQKYAWDNYKYMNVYIMRDLYNDNDYYNSGVSWYPDTWMSDNNLARTVYNGSYLGTNTNENFRRVLTHEFGHWLNLAHTFENGCSSPGDYVDDTPYTTSNSGTCNTDTEMCTGEGIPNGENFMDYTECYRMFTQGQVDRMIVALEEHPTRNTLWKIDNLIETVPSTVLPNIYSYSTTFEESILNNGSIDTMNIFLRGDAFTVDTGAMTENTHYTLANLPSGLSLQVVGTSDTTGYIAITGNADSHLNADDADSITLTFLNASLEGNDTSVLMNSILILDMDFMDPYGIHYVNLNDILCDINNTWTLFELENDPDYFILREIDEASYGTWFDTEDNRNDLRFETYIKPIICNDATLNITPLPFNYKIDETGNWNPGGDWPDEHNISTSTYTDWDGIEAYIGFRLDLTKTTHYGWFRATVASDGTSYILHDYAYHQKPDEPIFTGNRGFTYLKINSDTFKEDDSDDGSIITTLNIELHGDSLSVASGELTEDTHFTVTNVPDSLTFVITATTDTTATIELTGNATNHENSDDISNLTLNFLDEAFTGGTVANVSGSTNIIFSIDFISTTGIFDEENNTENSITVCPNPNDGSSFIIKLGDIYQGDLIINIFNITGKNVLTKKLIQFNGDEIPMQANELPSGIYTIQITIEYGVLNTKMIIE